MDTKSSIWWLMDTKSFKKHVIISKEASMISYLKNVPVHSWTPQNVVGKKNSENIKKIAKVGFGDETVSGNQRKTPLVIKMSFKHCNPGTQQLPLNLLHSTSRRKGTVAHMLRVLCLSCSFSGPFWSSTNMSHERCVLPTYCLPKWQSFAVR